MPMGCFVAVGYATNYNIFNAGTNARQLLTETKSLCSATIKIAKENTKSRRFYVFEYIVR